MSERKDINYFDWNVQYYVQDDQIVLACNSAYFKNEGQKNCSVNGKILLPGEAYSIERYNPKDFCTTSVPVVFADKTEPTNSLSVTRVIYHENAYTKQ